VNRIVFFLLLGLAGTVLSCRSGQKAAPPTAPQTFRILFKPGIVPVAELFAPSFKMKQAQPVNRSQNEWLITLHPGTQPLQEVPSFLRQMPSVISMVGTQGAAGNSQSQNTGKSKIKTHNY
jgi:hypothetical protein